MTVVVVTPPMLVVTSAEAKRHLRVEHSDDDDLITGLIAAAQAQIDGPDGWLGRSIGPQTLDFTGACPDLTGLVRLPFPPIGSVVFVKDLLGVAVDPNVYVLQPGGCLALRSGQGWPWSSWAGVTVRFQAGYPITPAGGQDPAVWTGPSSIRTAILMMVAELYEYRGSKTSNTLISNRTVRALLMPFQIWSV